MKILASTFLSVILISLCNSGLANSKPVLALSEKTEAPIMENRKITVSLEMKDTFYANLTGGTPEKIYPVMFSLNAVNTSLFTDNCDPAGDSIGKCSTRVPFDFSSSSSEKEGPGMGAILNIDRTLFGYAGTDKIGFTKDTILPTNVVFRVNATGDYNLTGSISLSPKSSFLQLLMNESKIAEQVFMYQTDKVSKQISSLTIGSIPEEVENITWLEIGNSNNWQIPTVYVGIDRVKAQDCDERTRNDITLFKESRNILVSENTLFMLTEKLKKLNPWSYGGVLFFRCEPSDLKNYPVINVYTEKYRIDITAEAYLDLNASRKIGFENSQYCPLAVEQMAGSESCITLGYNYFAYNQVIFSKQNKSVGLSGRDNLKTMTMVKADLSNISGFVGFLVLAIVFGFVYLRFFQKADELKKEINATPGDVRSYSFYEYSQMET